MPASIPKPSAQNERRYFAALDGLRLLASLNVVLFHLRSVGGLYGANLPSRLAFLLDQPAFHASLFFMLAGLIYQTKYGVVPSAFRPGAFLRRRFMALYPLHALTTLAMVPLIFFYTTPGAGVPPVLLSLLVHLSLVYSLVPFVPFGLNTPSWALSAFFLCYLLLKPALFAVRRLTSCKAVAGAAAACFALICLWGMIYTRWVGDWSWYLFFHIFAPIRFFEFFLGMLLGRLLDFFPAAGWKRAHALLVDICLVVLFAAVYVNARWYGQASSAERWFSYHVVAVFIFCGITFLLACNRGIVCALFSLSPVRKLGAISFYPYLLHIPFFGWAAFIAERFFGCRAFLHDPMVIVVLVAALYGLSLVFARHDVRYMFTRRTAAPGKNRETS